MQYVVVSKSQWKPFWLTTHLYAQNDWTGWHFRVSYDICTRTPSIKEEEKTCFRTSDKDGKLGLLRDVSPSQGLLQSVISQTEAD